MVYTPPKYPAAIPSVVDLPDRTDDVDWLSAARYNELKDELRAALIELGVLPKGAYADVTARLDFLEGRGMPAGTIVLWSGAISAIPGGWVICDGANSTPNLTDRFIIHADADAAGTNNVGDVGGEHTHTLGTNEIPSHVHDQKYYKDGGGGTENPAWETRTSNLNSFGLSTGPAGGGGSHNNKPKYYALAYIMKV